MTLTSHLMRHSLHTHMDAPATTHTHAQTDAPSPLAHTHTHTHTHTHITRGRERERELERREREESSEESPPPRPHPSKPTRTPDTHAHARKRVLPRATLCRANRCPALTTFRGPRSTNPQQLLCCCCCCCVATMYGGYALPDYGIPFMYAQVNPGWFGAPHVLPPPQGPVIYAAGVPAQQQQAQPDIRQHCQQEQSRTHRDIPMDVDLDHQPDEMPEVAHAHTKPTTVSVGTQTELRGTGIQAPGDEAQDKTASSKRALLVKRAPVGQLRGHVLAVAPVPGPPCRLESSKYKLCTDCEPG